MPRSLSHVLRWNGLSVKDRTGTCRTPLHAVGDTLQEIGIGKGQVDGDGNIVQRPQARFHLHREDDAWHKWSALRLVVFVGVEGKFDVVLIAAQRVVIDDDLKFLPSLGIFGGEQYRASLECLQTLALG